MPPQPPPNETWSTDVESLSCSLDDIGAYEDSLPRYGTEMPHDREASGSGFHTQPDFGTELGASIFGTPQPVSRGEYVWDSAEQIRGVAEDDIETPRDRVWPRPHRANAGVLAERWSPSLFQRYRG